MLDGPIVEATTPPVAGAVAQEVNGHDPALPGARAPVEQRQEAGKPEDASKQPGDSVEGDVVTAEEIAELARVIEQAAADSATFPQANEIALRAIATKGNLAENLILTGRSTREKARSAPTEGEGALTDEQRQRQIAFGYDEEIGGLQIKLLRIKNKREQQIILEEISVLEKEKDKTGIEENQLNGLAKLFSLGESTTTLIAENIENGTPMLAVAKIIESALVDKNVREELFLKLDGSGLPADQIKVFKDNLENQAEIKKLKKGAKAIGLLALIGMLFTIYSGFKGEKPGMG